MPWKDTCAMDEKIKFIAMIKSGVYSFASTCRQFEISRKSGYELLARYEEEGEQALAARSRARIRIRMRSTRRSRESCCTSKQLMFISVRAKCAISW
jgi:transposase